MKSNLTKLFRTIFFFLPMLLGILGLCIIEGESFLDAAFSSLLMYFFCYADKPANVYIELARWLAPAVTASGFLLAFYTIRDRLIHFIFFCTGKSIAVYGSDTEKEPILNKLRKCVINGKDSFIPASSYILLNDEETNFSFYTANKSKLKNSQIYLKCHSLPAEAVCDDNLHLFCPEETSARLFWKEQFLYPLAKANDFRLNIVFIGFEKLGEELLLSGLQNNIFSSEQKISYHIFGDGTRFEATHTELASISDPVCFYSEPWYLHKELIESAQMLIVLTQEKQTELLRELLLATTCDCIHVFASNAASISLLDEKDRLSVLDWKTEAQQPEHILSDNLFRLAKRINLRYAHIYSGVPETEEVMAQEWMKLDAFTRYSNMSCADYHEIRLRILESLGVQDKANLPADVLEIHSELEHIRWCRYHYLNNWRYGLPENGRNKDKKLRIHKNLIPYQELTDNEKEKDRENIRLLHNLSDIS